MSNIHPIDSDISNIIKNNLKIIKGNEKLEELTNDFKDRYGENSNYDVILIYLLCLYYLFFIVKKINYKIQINYLVSYKRKKKILI